jgi:hypothetical protein
LCLESIETRGQKHARFRGHESAHKGAVQALLLHICLPLIALFGSILSLWMPADVLPAGIFTAPQGAPIVDTAEKGCAVKIRAQPICILCHVVKLVGIVFVKTLINFLLRQGKDIRTATCPAR